jgi:hypothetical protein
LEFAEFMSEHFDQNSYCFDVPNGKLTRKSEITRPIFQMYEDPDNDPRVHPYYIIDPFDVNHNPGKQVKFPPNIV